MAIAALKTVQRRTKARPDRGKRGRSRITFPGTLPNSDKSTAIITTTLRHRRLGSSLGGLVIGLAP